MNYEMTGDIYIPRDSQKLRDTVEELEPGVLLEHFGYERKTMPAVSDISDRGEMNSGIRAADSTDVSQDFAGRKMSTEESDLASDLLGRKTWDWLDTGEGIWTGNTGELLENLGVDVPLGLPYMEKRDGDLYLLFRPHREECGDAGIDFYAQRYELECLYPSGRIVRFADLLQDGEKGGAAPVCTMDRALAEGEGKYRLEHLRRLCSRVLEIRREEGHVPEVSVRKYQEAYRETVEELGLCDLYGHSGTKEVQ